MMGDVARRLKSGETDFDRLRNQVKPEDFAKLILRIDDGTISNNAAKLVLEELWPTNVVVQLSGVSATGSIGIFKPVITVDSIIEAKGLKQMNDSSELEKIVDEVLAANPKNVDEYKAGNTKALNALVGQIMKGSKGKANPQQVNDLLRQKLG